MKRILMALSLVIGVTSVASAQEAGLGVKTTVGAYKATLPLVAVSNGIDPSVELHSAPVIGLELDYRFNTWIGAYGSLNGVFTQLGHTPLFELAGPNPTSSEATVVMSTLGALLSPGFLPVRPTLRLGLGSKWYDFDFPELESDNVIDMMLDLGLGMSANTGALSLMAEARWVPSQFDPAYLPIRLGTDPDRQVQSDWLFQMGFRYGLGWPR